MFNIVCHAVQRLLSVGHMFLETAKLGKNRTKPFARAGSWLRFNYRNQNKIFKAISRLSLVMLGVGLSALPAEAATRTAASASYSDVSAAIAASVDGDTVKIPAGSVTWTTTLNLNKAIMLIGAGTSSTIFNGNGGTMMTISLPADKPVRVSGIHFNNSRTTTVPTLILAGKTYSGSGTALTSFRIDHCKFSYGKRAVNPNGWCYGVIDHNTFVNCDIAVGLSGDDNAAWSRPIQPGSANTVCIEDNTFLIDNNITGEPNEQIYHQEGTRTTIRNNTFDGHSYTAGNSLFFDCHGNQGYNTGNDKTDFRGTILVEFYNNNLRAYKTYRMLYIRAGTIFAYNNAMTCDTGTPAAFALSEEESWQTQFFNPLRTAWPAQDQVTESFFWANTMNGKAVTACTLWNANDATFIQQGRDYWMSAPIATSKYASYKALVYPHPIVTAQDGGGTAPSAPTNFKLLAP